MSVTVASLRVSLGVDDSGYQAGLKRAEEVLEEFAARARRAGESAARGLLDGFRNLNGDALKTAGATGADESAAQLRAAAFQQWETQVQQAQAASAGEGTWRGPEAISAFRQEARNVPAARSPQAGADGGEAASPLRSRQQGPLAPSLQPLPQLREAAEAPAEPGRLGLAALNLQVKSEAMKRRAVREEAQAWRSAEAERTRIREEQTRLMLEQAEAQIAGAEAGRRAEAALQNLAPVLRREQEALLQDLRQQEPSTVRYWSTVREYWRAEYRIQGLNRAAQEEAGDNQQRALETVKRAQEQRARETLERVGAEAALVKAQLKNNPFLNATQRADRLIPFLLEQFKTLQSVRVDGESETDRFRRLTGAEEVRGQIYDALGASGKGAFARSLGGGLIPMFDVRKVRWVEGMLDRITRSSAAAAPLRDSQRDFFQASRSDGLSPQGADSREPSFGRTPDARLRGGRSEGPLRPAPLSPAATNVTVTVQAPPLGVTEYARVFRDPEFQRFLQGAIYQWMNRRSQAY